MLKKAIKQGVPETSKWVGGQDGGEWVNFVFAQDSIFYIDTYNDYALEFNCRYTYKITCPLVKEKEVRKAFKFTNGAHVIWDEETEVYKCIEFIKRKISK